MTNIKIWNEREIVGTKIKLESGASDKSFKAAHDNNVLEHVNWIYLQRNSAGCMIVLTKRADFGVDHEHFRKRSGQLDKK